MGIEPTVRAIARVLPLHHSTDCRRRRNPVAGRGGETGNGRCRAAGRRQTKKMWNWFMGLGPFDRRSGHCRHWNAIRERSVDGYQPSRTRVASWIPMLGRVIRATRSSAGPGRQVTAER